MNQAFEIQGILEFMADGRYQRSGLVTWTAEERYASECVMERTDEKTSEDACDVLQQRSPGAECQVDDRACVCTVPRQSPIQRSGRYQTHALRIEFDDDLSTVSDYCVHGDEITLMLPGVGHASLKRMLTGTTSSPVSTPTMTPPTTTLAPPITVTPSGPPPPSRPVAPQPTPPSPGSSGTTGGRGSTPEKAPTPGQTRELFSTNAPLIDLFVGQAGVYIVLSDALVLVSREGEELARVAAPRPINSAGFDGNVLAIADGAKLSSYDAELQWMVDTNLVEACAAGVLVSKGRFVCGPGNDWGRIFYTYDTATGELLASSQGFTYNGVPMRAVPGLDAFVSVTTNLSPSDYHLYIVGDDHAVTYVGESPYHGDIPVSSTYAWDAIPPQHLLTDTGLLLTMDEGCTSSSGQPGMACFVKDGALGTLAPGQAFVAMDTDARGKLHAIATDPDNVPTGLPQMPGAAILQRVDVAAREIEVQKVLKLSPFSVRSLRHDPGKNSVVIVYTVPVNPNQSSPGPIEEKVLLLEED